MLSWQATRGSVHEVSVSCPRTGFVLHLDWGIRRLPCGSRAHSPSADPCGCFLGDPSIQRAPDCVNSSHALGEHHAMSRTDRLSGIPSNRTRVHIPHFQLPATRVPRSIVAAARVFVSTANDVGICVDDEYAAAYRGH